VISTVVKTMPCVVITNRETKYIRSQKGDTVVLPIYSTNTNQFLNSFIAKNVHATDCFTVILIQ